MVEPVIIDCVMGQSAHRPVLLGFAPSDLLHRLSFADILDEDRGTGYQRPFNSRHSQDFRRYIKEPASTTIPLTLNLRPSDKPAWRIDEFGEGRARLVIEEGAQSIMAQVDCQHRLGHLADLRIQLPFMSFISLDAREEMEIFSVINGKAKGLSASLLDYHDAQLAEALAEERPELFIALKLNSLENSPWYRRLNLGGQTTSGLKRIVSLRMMQQAVLDFLKDTQLLPSTPVEDVIRIILDFWLAVATTLPDEWAQPRRHMLTKGIGVYALMHIAADIANECRDARRPCDRRAFAAALGDFAGTLDWSTTGPLKGFGGQGGVTEAVRFFREARARTRYRVVNG